LLPAQGDGGAHVPGADVEGRHQVQGVRAQTPQQPTLVRGDLSAALGGDLAVEQEPGQIVLDHAEPEQVAHIGSPAIVASSSKSSRAAVKARHRTRAACARAASSISTWCLLTWAAASAGSIFAAGRIDRATSSTLIRAREASISSWKSLWRIESKARRGLPRSLRSWARRVHGVWRLARVPAR